jgi:prolipoprotein diacylglyceryltransferase
MRFLLELIRTDTTFRFVGLSRNAWVSLAVIVVGVVVVARGVTAKCSQPTARHAARDDD